MVASHTRQTTSQATTTCQIAIIGAGPYGLAAAQLLRTSGIDIRVFGETMSYWQDHMPAGMFLRSSKEASNIGSRHGPLTIDAFEAASGITIPKPVPLDQFIAYGRWFQRQSIPDLDTRQVVEVRPRTRGFDVIVEDGEVIHADRVIVATGLATFPARPAIFDGLDSELASHPSDHAQLDRFAGRRVAVIGGGQSALESAALLHEAGADVEVIARAPAIRWLSRSAKLHSLPKRAQQLLYAPTDVGPPGLSWMVALPEIFRRLPAGVQDRVAYRSIRPAGAGWLVPRLADVPIITQQTVTAARPHDAGLSLTLSNGSDRLVDHVLLATGYRIDIGRLPFLSPDLLKSLRQTDGYPDLDPSFESSVPGLHFIGATAAASFGPIVRFVAGTWFTNRSLKRHLTLRKVAAA